MEFARKDAKLTSGNVTYFVGGSGHPLLYLHPAGGISVSKPLEALAARHTLYLPLTPG